MVSGAHRADRFGVRSQGEVDILTNDVTRARRAVAQGRFAPSHRALEQQWPAEHSRPGRARSSELAPVMLPVVPLVLGGRVAGAAAASGADGTSTAPLVLPRPIPLNAGARSTSPVAAAHPTPPGVLRHVRGWMLVLPVDGVALLAPVLVWPSVLLPVVAFTVISLLLMTGGGRYRARLHASFLDDLPSLLRNLVAAAGMVALPVALARSGDELVLFLRGVLVAGALLLVGRLVTTSLINVGRRRGWVQHPTLLVGGGEVAGVLARLVAEDRRSGLVVAGFVDAPGTELTGVPRLGDFCDLERAVRATGADVLLLADGDLDETEMVRALDDPAIADVDKLIVPRMHVLRTRNGLHDRIGPIPVARITPPRLSGVGAASKRVTDVVVAAAVLLLVSPLLAVCAAVVRADGEPAIYRQTRVGRDGATFECLKLRSMTAAAAAGADGPSWGTDRNANRITPFGRFIRATSIDELPQLWNVVRGDMSLVGPRPERPTFVDTFSAEHVGYSRRHRVRPGLTGLSQISGLRGDTSIGDRARTDNYYIENWSQYSDLAIAVRTVREILLARGR
jgi:exopolysaccharide biosynthesis polyprenyl glycosylphosphotransferase